MSKFKSWASELKRLEVEKERKNQAKAREVVLGRGQKRSESLINPLALLGSLESELPEKSILVADGGDFVATASYVVRPRGPLTWLDPGAYGTLGVGAGFCIGVKSDLSLSLSCSSVSHVSSQRCTRSTRMKRSLISKSL